MLPILDDAKSLSCRCFSAAALVVLLFAGTAAFAAEPSAAEAAGAPQQAAAEQKPPAEKNAVLKISAQQTGKKLELTISCARQTEPNAYELPGSSRSGIVVDIADAELKEPGALKLPEEFKIGLTAEAVKEAGQELLRLKFALPKPYTSRTLSRKENDIVVTVEDFFQDAQGAAAPAAPEKSYVPPAGAAAPAAPKDSLPKDSIDSHLLPQLDALKPAAAAGSGAAGLPSFNATGYDEAKPITVDFFKIDLHNVFRLLGEVSGTNIVVAEGVAGTLTLSLHEVPWDFALDIILNLKDLAKEQRHNTIVIYPKNKEFVWPERAAESGLTIDAVEQPEKKDGSPIVIGQESGDAQPPEATEARNFVAQGRQAEKSGSLETAVQFYEKALELWPDKAEQSKLANRIAAIYLVSLGQNAKAAYFAKKALAADKKNSSAALNAAVAHANMEENSQAQQYFDQSVSIGTPSREALLSYALFSERRQQPEAALRLLSKYSELYGESLDSMVARARVLDQQGHREDADRVYMAILHAGFQVPQDLRTFIASRLSSQSRQSLPPQKYQGR